MESSGKRLMLALDVSGSMGCGQIGGVSGLTPRLGCAAMAMTMVTAAVERDPIIVGFTGRYSLADTTLTPLNISPRQRCTVHTYGRDSVYRLNRDHAKRMGVSRMSEQPAVPTDLPISEFMPRPALVTPTHHIDRARFPAIDVHNHLGRWLSADRQWVVQDVPALLGMMEYCNLSGIVNLDGMWGDELEANLERYDRAYPGRFFTFAHCDWDLVTGPDFGTRMARQLEDSIRRGARGLKVWKTLGLHYRDGDGRLIPIDDPRLFDLWEAAADAAVPVLIHIADPVAFFQPLDRTNERWEELRAHPDWHFLGPEFPPFETLIAQFERLIAEHPRTTFIGAHVGCYAENLSWVGRMLDTYPNFYVDISARLAELGRQPYAARRFFVRYGGRIAFGLDAFPPAAQDYAPYFRFLETADEYFPYSPAEPGRQGRWRIYGINLQDEALRKVYHGTAAHLLGHVTS